MGHWVEISGLGSDSFSGYLALPRDGSGPGLLLIQEIWGVNAHIRDLAEQYAAEGFVVLAPDVFWRREHRVELGYDQSGTERAYLHYQSMDVSQAKSDLDQAVDFLERLDAVNGPLGVVGFCMGGKLAYELAENPKLSAGVSYYGSGIASTASRIKSMAFPFLFHFAAEDHLITLDEVRVLQPLIELSGDASFEIHQGVGHGFACPHRPAYSMRAALTAKATTLWFLSDCLLGGAQKFVDLRQPL
ncbi:dienelactone hydrolase family protein [Pseudomonas kurunegalensis]|uniref:dienelactone hydrolase family protein n=1 Tax=Pseudomonas kurunegalensis TaxID=485880 RepID=UPI00236474F7|nr:dienelactone hydrolase family protein [Pseudomonas kurunegalensis]MDD2134571.1 dienelactone hydrolase family protein [Pseudomonas kurunegalensis]